MGRVVPEAFLFSLTGPLECESIMRRYAFCRVISPACGSHPLALLRGYLCNVGNQTIFPMFGGLDATQREQSQRLDSTVTEVHAGYLRSVAHPVS
jgi:hypothetical protein